MSERPEYYQKNGIETKDIIGVVTNFVKENNTILNEIPAHHFFYIGNVIKYLTRYLSKGSPVHDLTKAITYLTFLRDDTSDAIIQQGLEDRVE